MKVLMFGWEFPPKIYGGLAVASYGITKGLSLQGDMETIFCMPKPSGEEEKFLKIIGMIHTILLNRINSRIDFATRTVKIRSMHMDAKRLSATISMPIFLICM